MATQTISNTLIAKLVPESRHYDVRDNKLKGFLIRVNPSGSMSYVVQYARGKRIHIGKVGVLTPAQARERAIQILADHSTGGDPQKKKQESRKLITLGEFITKDYLPWFAAHYRTPQSQRNRLNYFTHLFDKPLDQIKVHDLEKWRTSALETIKPNTVNKGINALKSVFNCAVKWEIISDHPFGKIKALKYDDTRIRYLTESEETALFEALHQRDTMLKKQRDSANQWRKERDYSLYPSLSHNEYADHLLPLVILAVTTGLRQQELFTLKRAQVNLAQRYISQLGKNAKIRHIPLNDNAHQALSAWMQQSTGEYIFPSPEKPKQPIGNVKKAWGKVLDDAGIVNFHWHDLRHHFASKLVMAGVDLNTVRELLGHADIQMTLRYAHLAPEHKAEAVAKIHFAGMRAKR